MLDKPKTAGKVYLLPVEQIEPAAHQARTVFDEQELARLAVSILEHGLLQPVTVQRIGKKRYRLIAGERRLRACRMANLKQIPALLSECDEQTAAALGLVENLQRQPLDPFEQARGIREMIGLWGCTQEEAAHRLGMAQPTLANKLRLLALNGEQQRFCLEQGLTERHARAVLRLPEGEARTLALRRMAQQGMNARQADELVSGLLNGEGKKMLRPRRRVMVRDVRVFVNTIDRAVRLMKDAGVPAQVGRTDGEDYIEYRVRIPTHAAQTEQGRGAEQPTVGAAR